MRSNVKVGLALAGFALGAVLLADAYAGNVAATSAPNSDVQLFSVEMNLGDYLGYVGSTAGAAVLIDDLTYSVELDPCCALPECEMFRPTDILEGHWDGNNSSEVHAGIDPQHETLWQSAFLGGFGNYAMRWAFARGTSFRACMYNGASGMIGGGAFDMVSHQIYGETIGRERGVGFISAWVPEPGPDVELPSISSVTTSVSLAIAMVNTSESRHYQTPEVFYTGSNPPSSSTDFIQFVSDWDRLNGGNFCEYNTAKVCVKGRIVLSSSAPVRNYTDLGITHP